MGDKDMTFAEAVAAMDAGYVVERDDDNTDEGGLTQWRKDFHSIRYFRRYRQRNRDKTWESWMAWECAGFEWDDIHAIDWRVVEEEASSMTGTEAVTALDAGYIIERSMGSQDKELCTIQYRIRDRHYFMRILVADEGWSSGWSAWRETGLFYDDLHATNWRVVEDSL